MTKSIKEKTRLKNIRDYKNNDNKVIDDSMIKIKIKIDSSFYDDEDEELFSVNRKIYKDVVLKYKEAIKQKLIPLVEKTHIFEYTLKLEVMTHFQKGFENHNELTAVLYVGRDTFSGNPLFIALATDENKKPSFPELVDIFENLVIAFVKTESNKEFSICRDGAFIPYIQNIKPLKIEFKDTYFYNDIYRLYKFFYRYRKEISVDYLVYTYNYMTQSISVTLYKDEQDYKCILNPISFDDRELLVDIYESGIIQSPRENLDGLTLQDILDEHCMLSY